MAELELEDIQGIIVRGYGSLNDTYFIFLAIEDVDASKTWLSEMANEIRNGEARPYDPVVNIALTFQGLGKLGLPESVLSQFPRELREGMITPHRSRILGDHGVSAPENWEWGGPTNPGFHILLMLYAQDEAQLQAYYASQAQRFTKQGMREIHKLHALTLNGRKEHFGFRDGIAQPLIEGLDKPGAPSNTVRTGEFILGYPNEYDQYPISPLLEPGMDPAGVLSQSANQPVLRDLGRNGSYLVFRQLSQRVHRFWDILHQATKNPDGTSNYDAMIRLASKMVGRWPSGAPLMNSPDRDNPALQDDDSFGYHHVDPYGYRSPIGSHTRRTNPRDVLEPRPGSQRSIDLGNRHRIIRRGRAYGRPIAESMDPVEILNKGEDNQDRGLDFLCFNTTIGRQFEFIQQTWANGKKFAGLYDDADPIIGDHDPKDNGDTGTFTVQASPMRQRVKSIPRFVETKGGAFFFMPSIRALRYIANSPGTQGRGR
jgi:Dyp-type peroxidase family